MKFIESRGNDGKHPSTVSFSHAILHPMSSYGGIYIPEQLPQLDQTFLQQHIHSDYKTLAGAVIALFDIDIEQAVIDQALDLYDQFDDADNPVPVVKVKDDLFVCELYHGPTRAFKDMALQPFGMILSALAKQRNEKYLILAATSGDTGPAALETFKNKHNVQVVCLYPEGGTSDVQRLQMVTENAENLKVIGIKGDFDDAQHALKTLLSSSEFNRKLDEKKISLSAANSVNFGRIIFQIIYHIYSYLQLLKQQAVSFGESINLNVPSGNFGNALGAYYAKKMGLAINKIIISSNANNVLTELIRNGSYDISDKSVIPTTSPAMDILKSSNIERILYDLYGAERTKDLMQQLDRDKKYQLSEDELQQLQISFSADFCDDQSGQQYIKEYFDSGYLMDPHTATCIKAYKQGEHKGRKMVVYSTAEWTKFSPTIAHALTGHKKLHDLQALKQISDTAGIVIPDMIQELFNKEIAQSMVIDKQYIESEILKFL